MKHFFLQGVNTKIFFFRLCKPSQGVQCRKTSWSQWQELPKYLLGRLLKKASIFIVIWFALNKSTICSHTHQVFVSSISISILSPTLTKFMCPPPPFWGLLPPPASALRDGQDYLHLHVFLFFLVFRVFEIGLNQCAWFEGTIPLLSQCANKMLKTPFWCIGCLKGAISPLS